jgi:hypothetical protein
MERDIAVYNHDGELVQWMDEKRLRRLIACGRVTRVVKNRSGRIKRASLHRMPGEPKPSMLRDYVGTKYSFRQHLKDGSHCYRLRGLGDNPLTERELAPEEVRPIFLRVVLECLASGAC